MGKSLREATDERLGEGAYERLLTEAIEENRYSFSPTIGWEERRSFARNMLFELCRADGVPDVPAIAEDVIVDSYCAPEGPLDLACNEAARTLHATRLPARFATSSRRPESRKTSTSYGGPTPSSTCGTTTSSTRRATLIWERYTTPSSQPRSRSTFA